MSAGWTVLHLFVEDDEQHPSAVGGLTDVQAAHLDMWFDHDTLRCGCGAVSHQLGWRLREVRHRRQLPGELTVKWLFGRYGEVKRD